MDKTNNNNFISAPKCKSLTHIRKYHNKNKPEYYDEVNDPYYWLTDKSNPEVIDYLADENKYTKAIMQDTESLQIEIFKEIKNRIQETDTTAPYQVNNYYYYFKTVAEQEYSIFCRKLKENPDNTDEQILLDENALARDYDFFNVSDIDVSPCHRYLAYTVDTKGDEQYSLYVKDLLSETTHNISEFDNTGLVSSRALWSADSKALLYIKLDHSLRPYQLWTFDFAKFQNNQAANNSLLFTEPDERFWLDAELSRSHCYIFLSLQSKLSSEVHFFSANNICEQTRHNIQVIRKRQQHIEYFVDHHLSQGKNDFYLLINNKDKPNYELYRTGLNNPSLHILDSWELLIEHNIEQKLSFIDCFNNFCVLFIKQYGINQINIIPKYDFSNIIELNIESKLNEQVYDLSPGHNDMYDTDYYLIEYESLATPDSVYRLNIDDVESPNNFSIELVKQDPVLNNFDRNNYICERLFIDVENNIKVPVSLIYHKDKYKKDGKHPLLLYGYGSYGISINPYFSHARISLLDRGIAFAIAHIRGGGELGEPWHYQGRLDCKKNTFSDFIAAANYLINNNYCSNNNLVIQGGSAGGLLMGNVINQRPDLFHCVIAEVPFVDCLNTMLDPNLPLTVTEYEEWGNPSDSAEVYQYIKSYAPYENISSQSYPNLLINNSLEDCRVSYWEAAKWTAKLRDLKTDENLLLLKTEMTAGHGGASGRYQALHDVAFNYCFILKCLGM